jgi:hypothetical protein
MAMEPDQVFEWVMAADVREALNDIPEADLIHSVVVEDRKELVRTAIGVTLLDHYERATQEAAIAKSALDVIGVSMETEASSQEPPEPLESSADVLLTKEDFLGISRSIDKPMLGYRVWGVLIRAHSNAVNAREKLTDPALGPDERWRLERRHAPEHLQLVERLVSNRRISWRTLKVLEDSGALEDLRSVGDSTVALIQAVLAAKKPTSDSPAPSGPR